MITVLQKIIGNYFLVNVLMIFSLYSNAEEFFLQANAAYQNNDYEKALSFYGKIEPKSAIVLYNMGNCWFHVGNYLQARICWKKAENRGGSSCQLLKAIEYNDAHAAQKLNIGSDSDKGYELQKYYKCFIQSYSLGFWQFLFLFSWYILLGGLCLLQRSRKKIWFIVILFPNLIIGSGLTLKFFLTIEEYAIVNQNTMLFAGTDELFTTRGKILRGQEVVIHEKQGAWCKVRNDKHTGWIKADTLEYVSC